MWKKYKKTEKTTYVFGVFPTIECLEHRKENVVSVIISPKGDTNEGVLKIQKLCNESKIPIEINQRIFEKIAAGENTYAVAVLKKYISPLDINDNHIVLINPSDMGNVGTICRTMLALDFKNLAVITPSVDVFDPKVIRSSMGAFFSLNIECYSSLEEYMKKFVRQNYFFTGDGETLLNDIKLNAPYSLIFGNESAGIDPKYKKLGKTVRLLQSNKVDSYNLAISVGIALYCTKL